MLFPQTESFYLREEGVRGRNDEVRGGMKFVFCMLFFSGAGTTNGYLLRTTFAARAGSGMEHPTRKNKTKNRTYSKCITRVNYA